MFNDTFKLLKQGAEGKLYFGTYLNKESIIKERFKKSYRHPDLDTHLTKERIKSESRAIVRAKIAGIRTPAIYLVDFERRIIIMEYFKNSVTVKEFINKYGEDKQQIETLSYAIGSVVGKLHLNNIIHGDLTTSNMLLIPKTKEWPEKVSIEDTELVLIDFGLSHTESSAEDKGVDLYVLERALISTHSGVEGLFVNILSAYKEFYKKGEVEVLNKLEEVRARGRKRTMVG